MPFLHSGDSPVDAPRFASDSPARASERFVSEVHESLRRQAVTEDNPTASTNACPGEFEEISKIIGGVETTILVETPYGDYLDKLKDDSLNEPISAVPPTLDATQENIASSAIEATKNLLAARTPEEFRDAFIALTKVFSGNRIVANPELRAESFKEITDFINIEMQKIDPSIRFGTSLISGAVVLGVRDGSRYRTVRELRNEITCPANPYA